MSYEHNISIIKSTLTNEVIQHEILILLRTNFKEENFKEENSSIFMENKDVNSKWKYLVSIESYSDKIILSMNISRDRRKSILELIESVLIKNKIEYEIEDI